MGKISQLLDDISANFRQPYILAELDFPPLDQKETWAVLGPIAAIRILCALLFYMVYFSYKPCYLRVFPRSTADWRTIIARAALLLSMTTPTLVERYERNDFPAIGAVAGFIAILFINKRNEKVLLFLAVIAFLVNLLIKYGTPAILR